MNRGQQKHYGSALILASALRLGATVEVIEETVLLGLSPRFMEVDGHVMPFDVSEPRNAAPGLRVTYPSGMTAVYLTASRANAERLLADAQLLAT